MIRYIKTLVVAVTLSLLIIADPVTAFEPGTAAFYDEETLTHWQHRYGQSTNRILMSIVAPVLKRGEQSALQDLVLKFPLREKDLMVFTASAQPPSVALPVRSLKFLDDLCVVHAWLAVNGYPTDKLQDYLAMLKYKDRAQFPDDRYPPPLTAFAVAAKAQQDPAINELALRYFNTARAFLLARGLGYVHTGTDADEKRADQFAVELMVRNAIVPIGIGLVFLSQAVWLPKRWEYADESDWRMALEASGYSLDAEVVRTVASELRQRRKAFTPDKRKNGGTERLTLLLRELNTIGDYLENPEAQKHLAKTVKSMSPAALSTAPR